MWLVVGLAAVVIGVVPVLSGGVRGAVIAAGALVVFVAVERINARRKLGPGEPPWPHGWSGHAPLVF